MQHPPRLSLSCGTEAALRAAAAMGRVMLTANAGGATHERIGPIAAVAVDGDVIRLTGEAHDAAIDRGAIGVVVADRTGRMKDKILPRLEFHDEAGETLFSIICLDGIEPFDAALAELGDGAPLPEKAKPDSNPATLADGDPGASPFVAAAASAKPIAIAIHRPGLVQRWTGTVAAMTPAMGFINVMTPNFHLHLRGGAVSRWARTEDRGETLLSAENGDGKAIGLHLRGPSDAFDAPDEPRPSHAT